MKFQQKEMPFRVGGMHTRPLPIAIQFNSTSAAVFAFNHLKIPIQTYKEVNNVNLASALREIPTWSVMCHKLNRHSKYFIDVRLGSKSGIYCNVKEVFRSLKGASPRFQWAFVYGDFGHALISSILGGKSPPDYLWDYHPYEHPEHAAQIKAHVLSPDTIPTPPRQPQPKVLVSDVRVPEPSPQQPRAPVSNPDSSRNHSVDHEELIAVALALEARNPWVEKYLAAIEVPVDDYAGIELKFELSDSRAQFIHDMNKRYGDRHATWDFLYSLLAMEVHGKKESWD
ncbi:hypothetical protein VNI00_018803 [Paramarasmius palmivorus]|uniref:Uncharacterized protein n=1 Tax=Paramarasmius palmivorus TaxID=297713 RepID=A0AAW0AUW1_9AGAR